MSLTDENRTLKPSDKPFKVSDSHGLYLLVKPGGSRHGISNTVLAVKNPHCAGCLSSHLPVRCATAT